MAGGGAALTYTAEHGLHRGDLHAVRLPVGG